VYNQSAHVKGYLTENKQFIHNYNYFILILSFSDSFLSSWFPCDHTFKALIVLPYQPFHALDQFRIVFLKIKINKVKVLMQGKLFQRCTHFLYCSILSSGGKVNTRRMSQPDMESIFTKIIYELFWS